MENDRFAVYSWDSQISKWRPVDNTAPPMTKPDAQMLRRFMSSLDATGSYTIQYVQPSRIFHHAV